ncbi:gamma-glutamyltranspeptidase [Pedobacter sp. UYP24]
MPKTIRHLRVYVEDGALDCLSATKLVDKGYLLKPSGGIGRVDAILKTKWGYYQGGADPRGDDLYLGW